MELLNTINNLGDGLKLGLLVIVLILIGLLWDIITRIFRTINIGLHGWPPPHLNADGARKSEYEVDDDEDENRIND